MFLRNVILFLGVFISSLAIVSEVPETSESASGTATQ